MDGKRPTPTVPPLGATSQRDKMRPAMSMISLKPSSKASEVAHGAPSPRSKRPKESLKELGQTGTQSENLPNPKSPMSASQPRLPDAAPAPPSSSRAALPTSSSAPNLKTADFIPIGEFSTSWMRDENKTEGPSAFEQRFGEVAASSSSRSRIGTSPESLSFPEVTLDVACFPKKHKTGTGKTHLPSEEPTFLHVKSWFNWFSSDWVVVKRVSQPYARVTDEEVLPVHNYDTDPLTSLAKVPSNAPGSARRHLGSALSLNLCPGDFYFSICEVHTQKTDAENRAARQLERLRLLRTYDPNFEWNSMEGVMCKRIPRTTAHECDPNLLYSPEEGFRDVLMEVDALQFDLGTYEPFFCTAFLWNAATRTRMSEKFHFDFNTPEMKELMGDPATPNPKTTARKALFQITQPSENCFIFFELKTVLHGPTDAEDYYCKAGTASKKDLDKTRTKAKTDLEGACRRLGKFRQSFGWAVMPMFTGKEVNVGRTQISPICLLHNKDDIGELVESVRSKSKKHKDLLGTLTITLTDMVKGKETVCNFIDPFFRTVTDASIAHPSGLKVSDAPDAPLCRQVETFADQPVPQPFLDFVNVMYLYPESLNFSSRDRKTRNIAVKVELRDCDDLTKLGLPAIYSHSSSAYPLLNFVFLDVWYHNQTPTFSDEIKIALPENLSDKHHILFTFWNISAKEKKNEQSISECVGFAVMPLLDTHKFVSHNNGNHHSVMVSAAKAESGYLRRQETGLKPLLQVSFRLYSSVFTQDESLSAVYAAYDAQNDDDLMKAFDGLKNANDSMVVQHLPAMLDIMFDVMVRTSCEKPTLLGRQALRSMVMVLNKVRRKTSEGSVRCTILENYVNYGFNRSDVAHSLFNCFLMCFAGSSMPSGPDDVESIHHVAWFLYECATKSMILNLHTNGGLNKRVRDVGFTHEFLTSLLASLKQVAKHLKKYSETVSHPATLLNRATSLFFTDLLLMFDRGDVLSLVFRYIDELTRTTPQDGNVNRPVMFVHMFEMLKILNDSEHFIGLHQPMGFRIKSSDIYKTVTDRFPLVSKVVEQVVLVLSDPVLAGDTSNNCATLAIQTMYESLRKIEYNKLYQRPESLRYLSLMWWSVPLLATSHLRSISRWIKTAPVFEKRDFFICVLWTLKSVRNADLLKWWKCETSQMLAAFWDLMLTCLDVFEYQPAIGTRKAHKAYSETAKRMLMNQETVGNLNLNELMPKAASDRQAQALEAALSSEVTLLLLDTVEDFIETFYEDLKTVNPTPQLLIKVCAVLVSMLKKPQSERVMHNLFATLRGFITKFHLSLFKSTNSLLEDITYEVLRHSNQATMSLRTEASTTLYLLLKLNYIDCGNFGRSSIICISSISRFIADTEVTDDARLKHTFNRIVQYAIHDYSIPDTPATVSIIANGRNQTPVAISYIKARFTRNVQDLSHTLAKIIGDTVQIHDAAINHDTESVADLYYGIAHGYRDIPDLRVQWLSKLGKYQESKENFVEAAICVLHIANLIGDYLRSKYGMTADQDVFKSVCPSISEFANIDVEGTCQSTQFSEAGYINNIRMATRYFNRAQYWEYAGMCYKLLLPVYEGQGNNQQLHQAYKSLADIYKDVWGRNTAVTMASYYRVGFYGAKFGPELDGKEFVYKESVYKHLFDLKQEFEKLSEVYRMPVTVLQDSNVVDRKRLDASTLYIQLTSVEPYFTERELETRNTYFARNSNLLQFVFEKPFTASGKAHAENLDEQFIRKTILKVEHSFPYMLKRLSVVGKSEVVLEPIEVATVSLSAKVREIFAELKQTPPNAKTFQRVLQGCITAQVNVGPVAVAKAFLGNPEKFQHDKLRVLRKKIKEFLKGCQEMLVVNKNMADTNPAHQAELEASFRQLELEMRQYIQKAGDHLRQARATTEVTSDVSDTDMATEIMGDDDEDSAAMSDFE